MTSDLIRDDDLVKRLDEAAPSENETALTGFRKENDLRWQAARCIEALEAGTATLAKRLCDALARLGDADRRVEEEREAIASFMENVARDEKPDVRSALLTAVSVIRSRSTREQVSDSSTACSTAAAPISQSNNHADTVSAEAPEKVTQTE